MKKGFKGNIEELTEENSSFRRVLYTGHNIQLVLMSLLPGEDIGMEVHDDTDQFFRFEEGEGKVVINETEYQVKDDDAVVVPAGSPHNVINTSDTDPLRFYTVYAPPHHKDGTVHVTKADAQASDEHFDGQTTEG